MNRFRTLKADEIECRVAMVKNDPSKAATKNGVSVLLYKTARTDADMLDEAFGPEFWENDFKLIDGVLYGGIGVDYDKAGEGLVWKWDAGTESNTEAEKGRASDAFKRAGFKHGIGRELYSAPFIWINATKLKKLTGNKCYDSFSVASIGYSEARKINHLIITNQSGEIVYEMGEAPTGAELICAEQKPEDDPVPVYCEDCMKPIRPVRFEGKDYSVSDIMEKSLKHFKRYLCWECADKAARTAKREAEAYARREDGDE